MMAEPNKTMSNQYHEMYKIVLIGDSCVGKTRILFRFLNSAYVSDTHTLTFYQKNVEMDGTRIQLLLFDSPGVERFDCKTTGFYRGEFKGISFDGIMLVYDVTKERSFDCVKIWIEDMINNVSPDIKIIIVGNTQNKNGERQVSYANGIAIACEYNVTFMEVDAITSTNVDKAFMSLIEDIKMTKARKSYIDKFIDSYRSPLKGQLIELFGQDSLHDVLRSHPRFIRIILYSIMIKTSNFDQSFLDTISKKCGVSGLFDNLNDVIQYSEALRAGIREKICIKAFVLGTTGAGKTCLSKAIKKKNCYNKTPPKTVVLDIHESHLDENIKLKLFDAGGDSEYYLISTQFLHSECIFIIVVDGTIYSKNLFQPCIGVYLDVIVSDCQSGYLFVVISKQDDNSFKFKEEDAIHIESQITSYIHSHGSNLLFRKDNIWKLTTRDKSNIDSFREELKRIIVADNDLLDKRCVPYDWSKFVEKLKSPVMEYTEVKQCYDQFIFPKIDYIDPVAQVSIYEKEILVKLEKMLKNYLQTEKYVLSKSQSYKEQSETKVPNKSKHSVIEKLSGKNKEHESPNNSVPKEEGIESKGKTHAEKNDDVNEVHAVDTILRFHRNHGRIIWLENHRKTVFTEPLFLLELLRSVIRHDLKKHVIGCKLTNFSVREILDRGLLNMDDLHSLMKCADLKHRLPGRDAKELLVNILETLGLAARTLDGKLFIPALIRNNNLELIKSFERSIVQHYENCLTMELEVDKCGSSGLYMRMLVKLKNKKIILQNLFSQKIENRTNGIVSGVEGSIKMEKKDKSIEEFSFLFLEKERMIDSPAEYVDIAFGGENAGMASFRTITIYIKPIRGSDTLLWNVLGIFKNTIKNELQELRRTKVMNAKYRIYCYGCCKAANIGYFETNSDFRIINNTDLCSGKGARHHLASFEEDEKKWMWNPANQGEITKLFTNQNIAEYDNKRTFNELYAILEPGDQIWYYKKAGENKLALGNAYAHVMVYVGNDEVVHVYKPKLALPLIAQIEKHHIDKAIPMDVRDEPNFFLGHEVLNSLPVANEKEIIANKALACLKHDDYPVIKFNYNAIKTNCETFANALLGKYDYCEQACGLNENIRRAQGFVSPLVKGFKLTRKPLMQQIQERLASKGYLE